MNDHQTHPVGIFDSGVGGLSVLREIRRLLPGLPLVYIADQAHIPYGNKPLEDIRHFSFEITRLLLARGARLIVVACNTASAAALSSLREAHPDIPFVGMEPAVKPASQQTHSRVVGVLATPATFHGRMYSTLVERFAQDVQILTSTLPGLVEAIERGELETPATRAILAGAIRPMVEAGADTLVLGCTHFPFVLPLIRRIAGKGVTVIDPAPAVARRAAFLLEERGLLPAKTEQMGPQFATSGDPARFSRMLEELLNLRADAQPLHWDADTQKLTEMRQSEWH
jgi:glutamate racemase